MGRVDRGNENVMKKKITFLSSCIMLFALCSSAQVQPQAKAPTDWLALNRFGVPVEVLRFQPSRESFVCSAILRVRTSLSSGRYADNKLDRLPALADELVSLKVDVLIATSTPGAPSCKECDQNNPHHFL